MSEFKSELTRMAKAVITTPAKNGPEIVFVYDGNQLYLPGDLIMPEETEGQAVLRALSFQTGLSKESIKPTDKRGPYNVSRDSGEVNETWTLFFGHTAVPISEMLPEEQHKIIGFDVHTIVNSTDPRVSEITRQILQHSIIDLSIL